MSSVRNMLTSIFKSVPMATRQKGLLGGFLVALIAALNPMSYFRKPYLGAIVWIVMVWWFLRSNPLHLVRPRDPEKWNPSWWQFVKALFFGLLFTPIPMFFINCAILFTAKFDAMISN